MIDYEAHANKIIEDLAAARAELARSYERYDKLWNTHVTAEQAHLEAIVMFSQALLTAIQSKKEGCGTEAELTGANRRIDELESNNRTLALKADRKATVEYNKQSNLGLALADTLGVALEDASDKIHRIRVACALWRDTVDISDPLQQGMLIAANSILKILDKKDGIPNVEP